MMNKYNNMCYDIGPTISREVMGMADQKTINVLLQKPKPEPYVNGKYPLKIHLDGIAQLQNTDISKDEFQKVLTQIIHKLKNEITARNIAKPYSDKVVRIEDLRCAHITQKVDGSVLFLFHFTTLDNQTTVLSQAVELLLRTHQDEVRLPADAFSTRNVEITVHPPGYVNFEKIQVGDTLVKKEIAFVVFSTDKRKAETSGGYGALNQAAIYHQIFGAELMEVNTNDMVEQFSLLGTGTIFASVIFPTVSGLKEPLF